MDPITNSIAAVGSLALLLQPSAVPPSADAATNAAAPAAPTALFGDWGGVRTKLSERGVDFTAQYFAEVMSNVHGGSRHGTVYDGLVNLSSDVDLEKFVGWKHAHFHAAFLNPHGKSLTDRYVNDLFVLSNLDASDDAHLFELWLEQHWRDDQLSVRAGQIAVDQEFAFTDQGALFNNAAFGWFPIAGNNVTAPVYPQGAPGLRIKWSPSETWYAQFAIADGDVNPTDAAGNKTNPHGVEFTFNEGAFLIGELGRSWQWDATPGSIKLGGWLHTERTADIRYDNTGLSLADPLTSGIAAERGPNWGLYIVAEQVVWRENPAQTDSAEGVGVFARCGYAPGDRNVICCYIESGLTGTGLLPGRDADICGIGCAFGRLSSAQRALGRDTNLFTGSNTPLPDFEMVVAAEYQAQIHPGLAIQPGVQYVLHPGGSRAGKDALVTGLRTVFEF